MTGSSGAKSRVVSQFGVGWHTKGLTSCSSQPPPPDLSDLRRSVRRVDFSRFIRTHTEPVGMTTLMPMRFGTVTSETYGGDVVSVPVAVVSRAPAPPAPAAWLCVRQTLGPERHCLAWVPAEHVRAT